MKKISFERVLRSKGKDVIIIGNGLRKIRDSKALSNNIKNQVPISFERINMYLFKVLGCLEYIEFWREVEIFEVQ